MNLCVPDSYLGPVLYLVDGQLHRDVEAVQNVASKHQRVLGRINGVDPALGAEYVEMKRRLMQIIDFIIIREMFSEVAANLLLLSVLQPPCQHTRWDEEGVSLLKLHSLASISSVSEEDVTLLP